MQLHSVSVGGSEPVGESFITIDDAIALAQELVARLSKLSEYQHPLAVRKGVKGMVTESDESKTLKAGAKTYFFDIRETKEGKPFLVVTESRFRGEDKERERSSIVVFPKYAQKFLEMIREGVQKLG